ncbi:hypothetical protein FH966_15575 [Lentibacillus cibarius]|uniref:DUF3993 domain-containing protein n=1 Tax=Lentibacillus cibarius TaxID=2583219 RepID=A0A549YM97_9BACI|nr:hypothetical protein [Lentibacillus cibarius]TRM13011.1 hypothetical protein FH966_15575 [Lentibacillus cibarius]
MRKRKFLNYILTGLVVMFFFIALQGIGNDSVSVVEGTDHIEADNAVTEKAKPASNSKTIKKLDHERVVSLTSQFMNLIVQETNESYKVLHYNSKNQLLKAFTKVSSKEVATKYIDYYFNEKPDGLYLKPTETPPWFHEEEDYDMIRKNDNTVEVTQTNTTELYGTRTINITFTFHNKWKITGITFD